MEEDGYPISIEEGMDRLTKMEGSHVFRCVNCQEIFETVLEWGCHAVAEHGDRPIEVEPVPKQ